MKDESKDLQKNKKCPKCGKPLEIKEIIKDGRKIGHSNRCIACGFISSMATEWEGAN